MFTSTIPTSECSYPIRRGVHSVPCGKRATLVFVRVAEGGKVKRTWAWWCDWHEDFYRKHLTFVAK